MAEKRKPTIVTQADYETRRDGVRDVIVEKEARTADEVRDEILATVDAWIAGKVKPLEIIKTCHADPKALETLSQTVKDVKGKRQYSNRPVKITRAHVLAAKLREVGPDGDAFDAAGGDWVPRIIVVLDDGSKLSLPWKPKKKKPPSAGGKG